jgi:phosphoenolpyruvate-protein phosphotransferase (PTS system enzyme I)
MISAIFDSDTKSAYSLQDMKKIIGISASPGIVTGKAFLYLDDTIKVPRYEIDEAEVDNEFQRFLDAAEKASEEIQELKDRASDSMKEEESRFLDSHILMLRDPDFTERINKELKNQQKNVEWILFEVMKELIDKLNSSQDHYLKERSIDIHDVSKRVLNHLMYRVRISLADLAEEVILVTHNLLPSDALQMNKRMVRGIAMDAGGKTSHTAILARSFEIPAVLGLSSVSQYINSGDKLIVDGNRGVVIIDPDEETENIYNKASRDWQKREVELLILNELSAETRDGKLIKMGANIEVVEEIDSVVSHGADGIGLFRSEFLFLQSGGYSSEDTQYDYYSRVLQGMNGKPVNIRTVDIGGDKLLPDLQPLDEKNPILGWRAIRFCLAHIDIFKTQLRALFRASVHGDLRIMYPMISGVEELDNVLAIVEEVKEDLRNEEIQFQENIPIGIMIEIPSAAMTSDILAKKVSFFSIGTNDLIQYTIAVDRGNEKVAYLYEPFHPGVLRMIKMIIENAHAQGIPVGMCGEMAGDPLASAILLGLGLDEYSMSPFGIPEIKRIIRSISMAEAEELVGIILDMRSYDEIDEFVKRWMNERFDILTS